MPSVLPVTRVDPIAKKMPVTPAVRWLRRHGVPFEPVVYPYVQRGGAAHSARVLGVELASVVKTMVFEDDRRQPVLVLMHGDREVSGKQLARVLQVKATRPCPPDVARRHTGYQVGGTSPFGTRRVMPVFVQRTVLERDPLWINGGKRGFLVRIAPAVLTEVLEAVAVDVAS